MPSPLCCRLAPASLIPLAALLALAGTAAAHPAEFLSIPPFSAPANPPSTREFISGPERLFNYGTGGELLTVKWVKFTLAAPIEGDTYLDIDSRIVSVAGPPGDLFMALFDGQGRLLVTDDTDGSFPTNFAAGLSFGSNSFRVPTDNLRLLGQDGSTLPAGEYWLALVAGNASTVSVGSSNWEVSTTSSLLLDYPRLGEPVYFASLSFTVGNTTSLSRPANDDCASPLPIGENPQPETPVWTGTNIGATKDGIIPCYSGTAGLAPRDVWFLYTPTSTGFAEVIADGGAGGAATPILARYAACGSAPLDCAGGASFDLGDAVRLSFPVVAGEPQLLGLSIRAGETGPLSLNVRLLPPPCPFFIPDGAISESEANCADSSNDGCNVSPPAFDTLAIGQTVHGRLFNTRETRDTDWYEFTLTRPSRVTLSFNAQFPSGAAILGDPFVAGTCTAPEVLSIVNTGYSRLCETFSGSIELPAGTHRAVIANTYFDGVGCGLGYEQYWLRIDAAPLAGTCLADIAGGLPSGGDGVVDGSDFVAFINSFAIGDSSINPAADVTGGAAGGGDGIIDGNDFVAFINAFALGC